MSHDADMTTEQHLQNTTAKTTFDQRLVRLISLAAIGLALASITAFVVVRSFDGPSTGTINTPRSALLDGDRFAVAVAEVAADRRG